MRPEPTRKRRLAARGAWPLAGLAAAIACGAATATAASPAAGSASALPPSPPASAPLQRKATMRYLGLAVYDATLSAPEGLSPDTWDARPLALTLQYHRSLRGDAIAERSLQEMRRGGPLDEAQAARWLAFMKAAFPDVEPGDRIVGQWSPATNTVSFVVKGGARHARVDAEFGRRFFGIWLAPHTSEPALRARLLGLS